MLTLTALAGLTASIGLCENVTTTYQLKAIAPAAGLVAYSVSTEWCEESEESGESRGTLESILVADFDTRGKAHYFTPAAGTKRKPEGTVRPAADWPAFEKEKGFVAVGAPGLFLQPGPCKASLVKAGKKPSPLPADPEPFKVYGLGLAVETPAGALPPIRIGSHVVAEGAASVVVVPVPGKPMVRVFTVTAVCEGGPPPGYFGEDDPGICYASWVRRKVDLTVKKYPGLAACLPTP